MCTDIKGILNTPVLQLPQCWTLPELFRDCLSMNMFGLSGAEFDQDVNIGGTNRDTHYVGLLSLDHLPTIPLLP